MLNENPRQNIPKIVEDVSSCRILAVPVGEYHETDPFREGMPNSRQAPEAGYNKVNCKFYMPAEGKCKLRYFFPRYVAIDHAPCVFAEM